MLKMLHMLTDLHGFAAGLVAILIVFTIAGLAGNRRRANSRTE